MSTESQYSPRAETTDALSSHDAEKLQPQEIPQSSGSAPFEHTWSLWCIFSVLCLLSFLTALDGTIITTSLPTITVAIGGASDGLYIWLAQSFIFASTAPQPLYGQISNIFGRRSPFLVAIVLFALGSGVAGGATNPAMLISGRSVQGLGAAGLYVLSDILICDLVPPRHRGPYLGAVLSTAGIGSTLGPVIGGALAENNWRWIFYLNIPISVLGFGIMVALLKVNYVRSFTWKHAFARVDYLGAAIFVPSTISIFYALITGGVERPWSSWRVILPLILGVVGWILYHVQQATPSICPSPSTPPHLFTNRTSAAGFALIFLSSVALY
jgi:MFS family permease